MIESITIFTPETSFFQVGQKLIRDKKETDIAVSKIRTRFGKVKVYLSDGSILNYGKFPFICTEFHAKNVFSWKRLIGK